VVVEVMKQFLKELPDPLCSSHLLDNWIDAACSLPPFSTPLFPASHLWCHHATFNGWTQQCQAILGGLRSRHWCLG